jgi:hypothetical protein
MSVRDDLVKVEEYNAAMELPFTGVLGIQAFLTMHPSKPSSVARTELNACSELCRVAELTLSGQEVEAARDNAHLYSALSRIFHSQQEKEHYRLKFAEVRKTLDSLLTQLSGGAVADSPKPDYLRKLAEELRQLANRIKHEIPRDAYLAALTSTTQPGSTTRAR